MRRRQRGAMLRNPPVPFFVVVSLTRWCCSVICCEGGGRRCVSQAHAQIQNRRVVQRSPRHEVKKKRKQRAFGSSVSGQEKRKKEKMDGGGELWCVRFFLGGARERVRVLYVKKKGEESENGEFSRNQRTAREVGRGITRNKHAKQGYRGEDGRRGGEAVAEPVNRKVSCELGKDTDVRTTRQSFEAVVREVRCEHCARLGEDEEAERRTNSCVRVRRGVVAVR